MPTFWNRGDTGLLSPMCRRQYTSLPTCRSHIAATHHGEVTGILVSGGTRRSYDIGAHNLYELQLKLFRIKLIELVLRIELPWDQGRHRMFYQSH